MLFTTAHLAYALKIGANEILLFSSGVGDKFSHFIISNEKISSVPDWNGVGEPPLSYENVTSLVLDKHKQLNGNIESKIRKISLSSKETYCNSTQKCPKTLWYYKVKVKGEKRATYVVLINGNFVEPFVE